MRKHNWKVGDGAIMYRDGHPVLPTVEVAKVYKNGNVVLKGDESRRQWRTMGDSLHPAAGAGYSRVHCKFATTELLHEAVNAAAERRHRRRVREAAEEMIRRPEAISSELLREILHALAVPAEDGSEAMEEQ